MVPEVSVIISCPADNGNISVLGLAQTQTHYSNAGQKLVNCIFTLS